MDNSGVRTIFVFTDLPIHYEYRVGLFPLVQSGLVINFSLIISDPKDTKRTRSISGNYIIKNIILKYTNEIPSLKGLTQYLEMEPFNL